MYIYNADNDELTWKDLIDILISDNKDKLLESKYNLNKRAHRPDKLFRHKDASTAETILHIAVRHGANRCLDFFLDNCSLESDIIDSPDNLGNTPLHLAVNRLDDIILQQLLDRGAYVNSRNNNGDSALHMLVMLYFQNKDIVMVNKCFEILINREDIDLSPMNMFRQTPVDMIKPCLEEKYSWALTFYNKLSKRYLQVTGNEMQLLEEQVNCEHGNSAHGSQDDISKVFNYILSNDGVALHNIFQNKNVMKSIQSMFLGSKPILHHLVAKLNVKLVKLFLDEEKNPKRVSVDNKLALHEALARGNWMIVDAILASMKSNEETKVDLKKWSFSLLRTVLQNNERIVNSFEDVNHIRCLKSLLDSAKLELNQRDKSYNYAALEIASENDCTEAVNMLEKRGARTFSRHFKNGKS